MHYLATILSDDPFFRKINKNLGRKLVLNTTTLRLKVTISHKIFFLPLLKVFVFETHIRNHITFLAELKFLVVHFGRVAIG